MATTRINSFRERFTELEVGLKREEKRPVWPSTEGLKLDTRFDLSQLEGFAGPAIEVKGVADKVKPPGMGDLRIDADLGKLDEGVRKIRRQQINERIRGWVEEAQELIAREQFLRALTLLEKALAADPTSVPALFLKGHCLFGLQEYEPALDALRVAREHVRDAETLVLILILQAACVRAATQQIEARLAELIGKKRFDQALALIEGELRQQPTNVALLYHRCIVLLLAGRIGPSKRAALDAMQRVNEENAGLFQGLLDHIDLQENQRYLEAARVALRHSDPAGALKHLQPCRNVLAGHEQYEALRSYAEERSPRGLLHSIFARGKAVPLTDDVRQKLLHWLLAEELNAGVAAMKAENFGKALTSFAAAAKIDDGCTIICYLHGLAIFQGFRQALEKKKGMPDLNRAIESLKAASNLLTRAGADPLVGAQSEVVRGLVDNDQAQLLEIARERARREEEARPVNELIRDFNALMDSLQENPIGSMEGLASAEMRFKQLRKRCEKLRKNRTKEQGRVLSQIIGAIDSNLGQVDKIRDKIRQNEQTQLVNSCVTTFNDMMKYFENNPIRSLEQLELARALVDSLRDMVNRARAGERRGSEGSRVLDRLEEAIDKVKGQLNG